MAYKVTQCTFEIITNGFLLTDRGLLVSPKAVTTIWYLIHGICIIKHPWAERPEMWEFHLPIYTTYVSKYFAVKSLYFEMSASLDHKNSVFVYWSMKTDTTEFMYCRLSLNEVLVKVTWLLYIHMVI